MEGRIQKRTNTRRETKIEKTYICGGHYIRGGHTHRGDILINNK